jgi:hypothetical protein
MSESWVGWMLGNIAAPLLAPLAIVGIVCGFSNDEHKEKLSPFLTVKDGQLAWVALAFSVSALYERDEMLRIYRHESSGVALTITVAAMLLACLIPLCGLLFPADKLSIRLNPSQWLIHYKIFVGSAVAAIGTGVSYMGIHFGWLY